MTETCFSAFGQDSWAWILIRDKMWHAVYRFFADGVHRPTVLCCYIPLLKDSQCNMSFVVLAAMENNGDPILSRKLLKFRKSRKLRKFLTKEVKYRKLKLNSIPEVFMMLNENSPFDDRVLKSSFSLKEIQNKGIYYS